jgi:hypothetical protein
MIRWELGRGRRLALALGVSAIASLGSAAGASADSPPAGGAFVIGDQSAVVGNTVTFWGAQWWKDNSLSGGSAPAAFKGFADTAIPQCGQPWSTDPGNSSDPPATVGPAANAQGWVPVVVSSNITKSGPVISGDTKEIAWVLVDPGYGPNPGHPGTGVVESIDNCSVLSGPGGGGPPIS